jgi:hypothetical protein
VVELVTSGRVAGRTAGPVFLADAPRPGAASPTRIAHGHDGTCLLRTDNRCALHSAAGPSALPVSCRHYPRVIRRDDRDTRVSLSHYCPTAASLLAGTSEPIIVDAPPGLVVDEPVEGLDARHALPPLIRPGMLTDPDGYEAWEAACVAALARQGNAASALSVISVATEALRAWTPSAGPLVDVVGRAFAMAERTSSRGTCRYAQAGGEIVAILAGSALPVAETSRQRLSADDERTVATYLAARAFGNWLCYQGRGLRTIIAWLHACNEIVRAFAASQASAKIDIVEAIRSSDFLMLHTIDSQAFADAAINLEL